jgi:hypothetical protein
LISSPMQISTSVGVVHAISSFLMFLEQPQYRLHRTWSQAPPEPGCHPNRACHAMRARREAWGRDARPNGRTRPLSPKKPSALSSRVLPRGASSCPVPSKLKWGTSRWWWAQPAGCDRPRGAGVCESGRPQPKVLNATGLSQERSGGPVVSDRSTVIQSADEGVR